MLIPASYITWDSRIHQRLMIWWPQLAANTIAAFVLQVVNAVTIQQLSATGLALAAVLKDLAIVASATYVLHESLATVQVLGFGGAVIGISIYSMLKLYPAWFDPPIPPKA